MKPIAAVILTGAVALLMTSSPVVAQDASHASVLPIHLVRDHGTTDGTCVVIYRENQQNGVTLYLLTAAGLFAPSTAEAPLRAIRVEIDGGRTIEVRTEDVFLPDSGAGHVAIVRVTASNTTLAARPLVFDSPAPGSVFLIAGHRLDGSPGTVTGRIEPTKLAVGEHRVADLAGCVGAPAVGQKGVFGIVRACGPGHPPDIVALSSERAFIARHVPGLAARAPKAAAQFTLADRQIRGPLLLVACDALNAGEVDVPLNLQPREWLVDAEAKFTNRRAVRLADVTVLKSDDRTVRLRFTLGGVPSPPPPSACPGGQALVSLHVNLAVGR